MSRTYPDQADEQVAERGSGFSDMPGIIHDFVEYNERVPGDFIQRLSTGLTALQRRLVSSAAEEAVRLGMPLYTVGGLPRDLWLGRRATDLDLVVVGDAVALGKELVARHGGRLTVHARFGTAKWDIRGTPILRTADGSGEPGPGPASHYLDLITARSETYQHPGALPTIAPGTIEEDIRRRDFTINTLAVRLDGNHYGEVRDECGATEDLNRREIRVLHERSFLDDPTRMYRAVRYETRFSFQVADHTMALMPGATHLIQSLSGQRIRHELDLIMDEEAAARMLLRLSERHLLRPIHEALPRTKEALRRVEEAGRAPSMRISGWSRREAAWILWLLAVTQSEIRSIGKRLHMTRATLGNMASAARLFGAAAGLDASRPSRCAAVLDAYPELVVYVVSLAGTGESRTILDRYLGEWRSVHAVTRGHDLRALGVSPGPAYGSILGRLRNAWIDGRVHDAEEERRLLHELLRKGVPKAGQKARTRAARGRSVPSRRGKD